MLYEVITIDRVDTEVRDRHQHVARRRRRVDATLMRVHGQRAADLAIKRRRHAEHELQLVDTGELAVFRTVGKMSSLIFAVFGSIESRQVIYIAPVLNRIDELGAPPVLNTNTAQQSVEQLWCS